MGDELAQFIHEALAAEQPFLRDRHGLLPFTGLPVEIREVEIVSAGGQFALAQFEIFFPVAELAINAAGMVEFPIPTHGLEGLRQCPPIVVCITGRVGHIVEIVVKAGITALDIGQDIIEKLLPVGRFDLFPGKRLCDLLQQARNTEVGVIIAAAVCIQFVQVRSEFGPQGQ
ncbi:MAG: hypothetical protein WBN86_05855 [Porticoccaceae bacterium]